MCYRALLLCYPSLAFRTASHLIATFHCLSYIEGPSMLDCQTCPFPIILSPTSSEPYYTDGGTRPGQPICVKNHCLASSALSVRHMPARLRVRDD